jgi:hypothetical protein
MGFKPCLSVVALLPTDWLHEDKDHKIKDGALEPSSAQGQHEESLSSQNEGCDTKEPGWVQPIETKAERLTAYAEEIMHHGRNKDINVNFR